MQVTVHERCCWPLLVLNGQIPDINNTQGTPLAGTTLLHLCADYDEMEIARWLLEHGMDVDAKAAVDANGFGGHTALFATVVSQPNSG